MDLIIRSATEDDLAAIVEIYNEQILHGTATFHTEPQTTADRAKWLAALHAERYPCLVAEVMNEETGSTRTVAFCSLWHFHERPAYDATAELSLYVHNDFRGKGVGERLLERMIEVANAECDRFHVIIAGVTTENTRTMKFWTAHGFELRGSIKEVGRKFGRWLDVAYFQLTL